MPTEEIPTETPFAFPERPEDAKLTLHIIVEPAQSSDEMTFSAQLSPSGEIWGHEIIEDMFRRARVVPLVGTYVLEIGSDAVARETGKDWITVTSAPEGVDGDDRRSIVHVLRGELYDYRNQLVQALRAFPPQDIVVQAAREVVSLITVGSIERTMGLSDTPVIDARTMVVEGVECVRCGFGLEGMLKSFTDVLSGRRSRQTEICAQVVDRDGQLAVLVGYLGHESSFAGILNRELAKRLKAAIESITIEVMTRVLVNSEGTRRMNERITAAIQATYGIDPTVIAAQVDAMEEEARAQLAPKEDAGVMDEEESDTDDDLEDGGHAHEQHSDGDDAKAAPPVPPAPPASPEAAQPPVG